MKRLFTLLLFTFSLCPLAFAQSADEQAILKLDEEFRAALTKNETATLERLTDSNFQDFNQFGQFFDRAAFVSLFKTFRPSKLTYSAIKVRLADNTASVTGLIRETSTSNFGQDQFLQFIHVWAKRADGWRLFIKQQQFDAKEGTVTPTGWAGQSNAYFLVGTDTTVKHGGQASAFLKAKFNEDRAISTGLAQAIKADAYRGKRLRLTGWVKGTVAFGQAFPWLRVNAEHEQGEVLSVDNRLSEGFFVRPDWTSFSIVLDVPEQAAAINLGFQLTGRGQVWLDDWQLEVVDNSVPSTNQTASEAMRKRLATMRVTTQFQQQAEAMKKRLPTLPTAPVNLDFETPGETTKP